MARCGFGEEARVLRPTPHYSLEFKREAVEIHRSSEKSVPKTAEELGVASESLRRWIRQHEADEGEREGLTTEEREELNRPRRENRILIPFRFTKAYLWGRC